MRLIDRTGLIIARDRGDSIWSFEISFQIFAFYLGSVKHEDDEGMYLPKFMKCQNSRERSWRAITKFVWQLGRYEPSSPVSYTAPLLPYFLCYHPTFLQNFFNWLTSTVYWLTFAPFYERVRPIFLPDNNQRRLRYRVWILINRNWLSVFLEILSTKLSSEAQSWYVHNNWKWLILWLQ